jgi:hypothetical protein
MIHLQKVEGNIAGPRVFYPERMKGAPIWVSLRKNLRIATSIN